MKQLLRFVILFIFIEASSSTSIFDENLDEYSGDTPMGGDDKAYQSTDVTRMKNVVKKPSAVVTLDPVAHFRINAGSRVVFGRKSFVMLRNGSSINLLDGTLAVNDRGVLTMHEGSRVDCNKSSLETHGAASIDLQPNASISVDLEFSNVLVSDSSLEMYLYSSLMHSANQLKLKDSRMVLGKHSRFRNQQDTTIVRSSISLEPNVEVDMISKGNFLLGSTLKLKRGSALLSVHSELVMINSTLGLAENGRIVFRGAVVYLISSTLEIRNPHTKFEVKYDGEFRLENVYCRLLSDFTLHEEDKLTIGQPGIHQAFDCVANNG